jgi:hypothetical protein
MPRSKCVQLYELDELADLGTAEAMERFRALGVGGK